MNGTGTNFDPFQMTAKLRDILSRGDSAELQNYIQDILNQYALSPFVQTFIAPLAQSLAAPLSQYLNGFMNRPMYYDTAGAGQEGSEEPKRPGSINSMLFEIHGFVIIRANIPEDVDIKDVKIYYSPGYITIKGDPSGVDHVVQLPPGSKQEGATAAFKDRVLEIRIPKEPTEKSENEIDIEQI